MSSSHYVFYWLTLIKGGGANDCSLRMRFNICKGHTTDYITGDFRTISSHVFSHQRKTDIFDEKSGHYVIGDGQTSPEKDLVLVQTNMPWNCPKESKSAKKHVVSTWYGRFWTNVNMVHNRWRIQTWMYLWFTEMLTADIYPGIWRLSWEFKSSSDVFLNLTRTKSPVLSHQ